MTPVWRMTAVSPQLCAVTINIISSVMNVIYYIDIYQMLLNGINALLVDITAQPIDEQNVPINL